MDIENRLASIRQRRGVSAAALAKRVGVTRQTIHSIESGAYVPNTAVSLQLARELEVSVEDLFALPGNVRALSSMSVAVLSATPARGRQPVRLSRVGEHWVAVPALPTPYFLTEADAFTTAVKSRRAEVDARPEDVERRLVVAGCDPALSLLARMTEPGIVTAPASSRLALEWLKQGKVHVAGTHLEDERTGVFNVPYVQSHFPGEDLVIVTFACWEEGLVVAGGNPKSIQQPEDLLRRRVRITNRERGSGSRLLLDRLLKDAKPKGYETEANGHLAAALEVFTGTSDCCIAARSAALAYGLDFVPLRQERFDLVLRRETLGVPAARVMMDVLQQSAMRRKLQEMAGYDTFRTGSVLPV